MKKFIPVIIVAAVLALALVVVMSRKSSNVSNKRKPAATVAPAAPTVEIQKKNKSSALMKEAQAAYDAKEYQKAIDKTREVLKNVDNMSQEAKNLLQISQIRIMEQAPKAVEPSEVAEQAPAIVARTPLTNKAK